MKRLNPDKEYALPQPESEVDKLLFQLHRAASNWYKTKNPEYVKQYHDLYYSLRSTGWNGAIDIDAELPDELMPQEYLSQLEAAKHQENAINSVNFEGVLSEEARRNSILIVDDEAGMRDVLTRILELSGYKVSAAQDKYQAAEYIHAEQPSLILLDGLKIFEVLAEKSLPDVPVIALTSRPTSSMPDFIVEGIGAVEVKGIGKVEVIDKNLEFPKLILEVLTAIDRNLS